MDQQLLVLNMGVLLLLGGFCSVVSKRFKMPVVIGYLVSGIIIAAIGWGTTETTEIIEFLSDIGLALMMFCIGMELNLDKLKKMGSFAVLVVMIQVPIILVGGIVLGGMVLGLDFLQSLIFGAIISGSSTAVVTIVLGDQKNMSKSDIDTLILVTVVEDVFQVLILSAISPLMKGSTMQIDGIIWMFVTIMIFMAASIVVGIAIFPKFLDWLQKKMPTEVLVIISLGICFGLSYLSMAIGMSMAIGAFLAGVIVSQSVSSHKVEEMVSPMKDVFMMMFFISIGMEISLQGIVNNLLLIVVIYLIYFVLKFSSVIIAYFVGNKPMSLAYHSSIALVAMGEFAFIISKEALDEGIITNDFYTAVIGAALVSMIALPLINRQNQKVINAFATKSPASIQGVYHKMDVQRSLIYNRISTISKSTMASMKTKLASSYISLFLIVVIQIIFVISSPTIVHFIDVHTPASISAYVATLALVLLDFLLLLPFIYALVREMKYVAKVMLDANRRAIAIGSKPSPFAKFMRFFVRSHSLIIVLILEFLILTVTPNGVDLVGNLIVLAAGVITITFISIYSYVRRS